jgi:DNA-binding transcriptional ArsR family regulator
VGRQGRRPPGGPPRSLAATLLTAAGIAAAPLLAAGLSGAGTLAERIAARATGPPAVIQALVRRQTVTRLPGDGKPKTLPLATGLAAPAIPRYHRGMAMKTARAGGTSLGVAAALFRGLADPTRLAILRRLAEGEARVADLTSTLGLAQSTVSGHLACLRDCGLITGRLEGRQMFYAVAHPELLDLLAAAEHLLRATGQQIALCPVYGIAAP